MLYGMDYVFSMGQPDEGDDLGDRATMMMSRRSLSFQVMQRNSNLLHQRNSHIYIFINNVIKYVSWQDMFFTLGVTLIITHIILNPVLLTVAPFVLVCTNTLIPHYLIIYKSDNIISETPINSYSIPRPVPLFSKEFFMNLTDTQNFMQIHIWLYDIHLKLFSDYLYFKREDISSLVLIGCVLVAVVNLTTVPILVPILVNHFWIVQLSLVCLVWLFIIGMHPHLRSKLLKWIYNEEVRAASQSTLKRVEDTLVSLLVEEAVVPAASLVEIYELQKWDPALKVWVPLGFSDDFFTTNTVSRKCQKLHKCDSLKEIKPPLGYIYVQPQWVLDIQVQWIEENLLQDVVIADENEKWVYDIGDVYRRRRWVREATLSRLSTPNSTVS